MQLLSRPRNPGVSFSNGLLFRLSTKDLAKEKGSSMEMEYVYVYIVDIETIAIFRHPLRALLRLVCIRVRGREIQ